MNKPVIDIDFSYTDMDILEFAVATLLDIAVANNMPHINVIEDLHKRIKDSIAELDAKIEANKKLN